jgi:hypothetical protein
MNQDRPKYEGKPTKAIKMTKTGISTVFLVLLLVVK